MEGAMIELTDEQRRTVHQVGEIPLLFSDSDTGRSYVLLPADVYMGLTGSFQSDDARALEPLLADLDPEDWQDLSVYVWIASGFSVPFPAC
jgi:hypothetical protein